MSFLRWLFGRKREPLLKKAQFLVGTARLSAIAMYTPLLERFPVLAEADRERCYFILTVAGVYTAAMSLARLQVSESREEGLAAVFMKELDQWDPDGIRAFRDCGDIFQSEFDRLTAAGYDPRFVGIDALGTWIVLNVLGRAPHGQEEWLLVRTAGGVVATDFIAWWQA